MPPQFKLASVVIIWIVTGIVLLAMIGTNQFEWLFGIILAGIAAGVSSGIMSEGDKSDKKSIVHAETTSGKAKRGENLAELMALLDEDDLYDLRQRVKQRLVDEIDSGNLSEVESFEELLNTRERQKRR